MNELHLLDRHAHVLEHVHLHWDEYHDARARQSPAAPLTIALSREVGTPAEQVARQVGKELGWAVHDHELPRRVASDLGIDVKLLERFDERHQNWLLECIEAFSSAHLVSEDVYVLRLVRVIRSLGKEGSCIVVGRGAAHFLPPESTLRIRLVAAREDRGAALASRLGLSRAGALRQVDEIDRDRDRFIRDHFNRDPQHPHNYDLVLNTSNLSSDACARQVIEALHQRQGAAVGSFAGARARACD